MPTFLWSGVWASSQLLVSSIPALTSLPSLHLRGDRSPRVTSGTKKGHIGSELGRQSVSTAPRPAGVMLLWDSRERPQPRYCHARPCGQTPTNHRGAYTNSGQSDPVLFPSPARSKPRFSRTRSRRRQSRLSLLLQSPPELTRASRLLAPFVVPGSFH